MGRDIGQQTFTSEDFLRFSEALKQETVLLREYISAGIFSDEDKPSIGYELEGWILDHRYVPAPRNEKFLKRIQHPRVVPELSRFNIEINGEPRQLTAGSLFKMFSEMQETWKIAQDAAHIDGNILLLIGTLPTIRESDLSLKNITRMNRYYALNERIFQERNGEPVHVQIEGRETLDTRHSNVMLEAGTTSFQLHLGAPVHSITNYYNASQLLSAPLIAAGANSPYLFHHDLWDETRIPLFEQAVEITDGLDRHKNRVLFGSKWLLTPDELFRENENLFRPLLPLSLSELPDSLPHLRLHNGTIWRWNRIIPGFNPGEKPHLRIEHRILPAGPTLIDMMANAALYFGAVKTFSDKMPDICKNFPFQSAEYNFYLAARSGLKSQLNWPDSKVVETSALLLEIIIPAAEEGLDRLGFPEEERNFFLGIIKQRILTGQTGTVWQRRFIAKYGKKWDKLTATYLENQRSGIPVHEWSN